MLTYRYGKYSWTAVDAFRGTFPFARTDWDRPNTTQTLSWTSTIKNNLVNEATYTYSLDQVFINVFQSDLYKRSEYGITYPYIFPENKEIPDKIPTITIDNFTEIDGGPYPSSSQGPIHSWADSVTWVKSRHTIKGGIVLEYSGEDDFDQINVQPIPGSTNNQNGRFEFRNSGTARTGAGIADAAMGLFTNYGEIGQRALTKWRALAADFFVQDSWKPRSNLTIEGGVRYSLWPPFYSQTNNIATFNPAYYDTSNQAVIDPKTGAIVSGPRYNGILLPGDGFPSDASDLAVYNDPAVLALFQGAPRGLTETHKNVFEPRGGVSYALNDKTIFKASVGHLPQPRHAERLAAARRQPAVPAAGQREQRLGGQPGRAQRRGRAAVRHDRDRSGLQAPDRVHVVGGRAARGAVRLHRRRDLRRPARASTCSARTTSTSSQPGTLQANPGVNSAALRPYKGYGVIRLSRERRRRLKYNALQISADRRYRNGFKFGLAYTLSHSEDNASDKRNVLFNSFDDTRLLGQLELRSPPRVQLLLHLRPAVLPRAELDRLARPGRMADRRARRSCARAPRSG